MKLALLCLLLLTTFAGADSWQLTEPEMPVGGQPGERVLIRLTGTSGKKPELKIAGLTETVPLIESTPGSYSAEIRLPDNGTKSLLLFESETGFRETVGQLRVLTQDLSWTAPAETVTRQGPHPDYDRLTPLYRGQKVAVDGFRGGWFRCRGSSTWVDGREVGLPGLSEEVLPPNRLNRVVVTEAPNGDALLTLEMLRPSELQVQHHPSTNILSLILHDSYQTTFDVRRPTGVAAFLGPIVVRPLTRPRAVALELSASSISGYQIKADGKAALHLRVRKPISASLEGLRVTVDAGHGGPKDKGTVGHGGLAEKTLNLKVAKALQKLLEERGAVVTMTRTTDTDVASLGDTDGSELQARVDHSVEAQSQLFLSVHHNARPSIEQGKVYHGTDIYWYQPHSQSLAKALADPIADALDEPQRSFRWRSFFVIRQTHAPAVLMEFQYLSNPVLEKTLLSQPDYPRKAAQGVVDGLERYLSQKP